MKSKEDELKQIFYAEALDQFEELNRLFIVLEKNHDDKQSVNAIFRITHTLKANAAGMGFDGIATLSHLLEDIFSEIKNGRLSLNQDTFNDLFRANDKLGELIEAVTSTSEKQVRYKGLVAKLKVILSESRGEERVQKASRDYVAEREAQATTESKKEEEFVTKDETPKSETTNTQEKENAPEPVSKLIPKEPIIEEEQPVVEEPSAPKISFSDLIQVPVQKLDNLLNLVGELAIEKDRIAANHKGRGSEYARLYRVTSDLQYSVMGVRLVQVNVLFQKFHRIVRDVAALESKKVNLVLEGTDIEIDRNILQIISDSLIHLVRNAISHGIETTDARTKNSKPEAGTLTLSASNEKDHVIINVIDDGKGIDAAAIRKKVIAKGLLPERSAMQTSDHDIVKFIFEPGFSSVEKVTQISGRGVGMDVVKKALDSIGGKIELSTKKGKGTTFRLLLPSSMAVKNALLFELNNAEFAIPLSFTEAVVSLYKKDVHKVSGGLVSSYLEQNMSVIFLKDIFNLERIEDVREPHVLHKSFDQTKNDTKLNIIIVKFNERLVGLVVDKLLQQKEIIEKTLSQPVDNAYFISGATILGNGNVCLVLDIPGTLNLLFNPVKFGSYDYATI
ncbi:chemotaxis protein CheA [Chondrinema litorale]|uniref:chemotaxis protein CheA n=1 Tax=Chondrinema litorale TaxID=2994555 RepID=UPI0025437D49|nr:chemotaxis protein CheA [Chondrinema litorale]UZR95188.1 chemotaxis protein CheA [Chondrinema litorale]